jgi:group I intron endonuclease
MITTPALDLERKGHIYTITNKINGRLYVGKTCNPHHRWQLHKSQLRHNKHHNDKFQADWNEHGEQQFEYEIIETIENGYTEKELSDRETYWYAHYGELCYL